MANWYILKNGEIQGPFDRERIQELAWTGNLGPEDQVTSDRLPFWYPARDVSGLEFPSLPRPKPPEPAPAHSRKNPPRPQPAPAPPPPAEPAQPAPATVTRIDPSSLPVAVPVAPPAPPAETGNEAPAGKRKIRIKRRPNSPRNPPGPPPSGARSPQAQPESTEPAPAEPSPRPPPPPRTIDSEERKIEYIDSDDNPLGSSQPLAEPGVNINWELVARLLFTGILLLFLAGIVLAWRSCRGRLPFYHPASTASQSERLGIVGKMLGDFIARTCPEGRVVLIFPPKTEAGKISPAALDAFRRALARSAGKRIREIKAIQIQNHAAGGSTLTAAALDRLIQSEGDADAFISFAGLPADFREMKLWRIPAAVRPALIIAAGPLPPGTIRAIKAGWLAAVVVYRPGPRLHYEFGSPPARKRAAAFCRILTQRNLETALRHYPHPISG